MDRTDLLVVAVVVLVFAVTSVVFEPPLLIYL